MNLTKCLPAMYLITACTFILDVSAAAQPVWQPRATERLLRLPASYLEKAIERDFASSELAVALGNAENDILLKQQTLEDINSAVSQSQGELKTELRHQLLVEKREYIERMGERLDLQRRQVKTRKWFYERLLSQPIRKSGSENTQRKLLVQQQTTARQRMESSLAKVDLKLFGSPEVQKSRYAMEYSKNITAIEKLVSAIESHPMNQQPDIGGEGLGHQAYLQRLIASTDAQLGILNQESTLLGHMAKLVALDALALSEEVEDADLIDSDIPETTDVASAVELFINR